MYEVVLFDIDGTLIERSSLAHREAIIGALNEVYAVELAISDWGEYCGWTDQLIIMDILRKKGVQQSTIEEKIEDCMNRAEIIFDQVILKTDDIYLLPGVPELLDSLEENGRLMGLATGNLKGIAYGKIRKVNLDGYFSIGGFGSDAKKRKDILNKAIERAQPYGPFGLDEICLFGDTPLDIEAAKEAGIAVIAVATGAFSYETLDALEPYYTFKDLSNTQEVMDVINQQPS